VSESHCAKLGTIHVSCDNNGHILALHALEQLQQTIACTTFTVVVSSAVTAFQSPS
jgi:hypothetical protein